MAKQTLGLIIILIITGVGIASPVVFGLGLISPDLAEINSAQAFDFHESLDATARNVGFSQTNEGTNLPVMIGLIIYGILGMIGVLFLVLTIIAGFRWMTAGGNEETVKQARQSITNGAIGIVIILASYAITSFIIKLVE